MTAKPEDLSETPSETPSETTDAAARERVLADAIRAMRFTGSIFLRAHFTTPWAYDSPSQAQVSAMLGAKRVMLFHIIAEGACRVALEDGKDVTLQRGDVVILPQADQHLMHGLAARADPVPIGTLLPPMPWATMPVIDYGGGSEPKTTIICGYLCSDELSFHPVGGALPPVLRVRPEPGPLANWVAASVEYVLSRGGSSEDADPLMQRLPELLFMECLRHYLRDQPTTSGWMAALADDVVGRALACLHREPAHAWTNEELAKRAATSRSVLDARFRAILGLAPMSYLAQWRLQLAARQLRTTDAAMIEIAEAAGYASEASFSRAFKRHVGMPPSHWRKAGRP